VTLALNALNVLRAAGVPPERWAEHRYQARAVTRRRSVGITKKSGGVAFERDYQWWVRGAQNGGAAR
jgi:hypothetical protein